MEVYRNSFENRLVTITKYDNHFILTLTQSGRDLSKLHCVTLQYPPPCECDDECSSEDWFSMTILSKDDGYKAMTVSNDGVINIVAKYKFRRPDNGKYHEWYTTQIPRDPLRAFVPISDDLCDFLGIDHGSKLSHILVNQAVTAYIKDNKLQSSNLGVIIPDEKLSKMLDYDGFVREVEMKSRGMRTHRDVPSDSTLTYNTLQFLLNMHYK